jgi:hypothetical protein
MRPRRCTDVAAMDGKETSQRSSGLCTGNGKTAPEGARVSQLIWSQSGTPSGAMAWDLIIGGKAARSGILAGVMVRKP